jgi:4-amino-4-deoxy-L-arabinose transferase-like glycosyltransferase
LAGVFLDENFGHFLPTGMGGTGEAARPVYYIFLRLLGGALPLTILIPALTLVLARAGFTNDAHQPLRFQLAMVLAVVLFFSAASAKRDDYILPALAPLAILFAALFTATGDRAGAVLRDASMAALGASVLMGIVAMMVIARDDGRLASLTPRLQSSDASYAAIFLQGFARRRMPFTEFAAADTLGAIVMLVGAFRHRPRLSGAGLAIVALAGSILWNGVLRPAEAATRSLANFAPEVHQRIGDAPVYVEHFDPEFSWYFGRGVPPLPRTIARGGAMGGPAYFVARPKELTRLAPAVRAHLRLIAESGLAGSGGGPALYRLPAMKTIADLNANPRGDK